MPLFTYPGPIIPTRLNNVSASVYLRGALVVRRGGAINEEMKVAASQHLAD